MGNRMLDSQVRLIDKSVNIELITTSIVSMNDSIYVMATFDFVTVLKKVSF